MSGWQILVKFELVYLALLSAYFAGVTAVLAKVGVKDDRFQYSNRDSHCCDRQCSPGLCIHQQPTFVLN